MEETTLERPAPTLNGGCTETKAREGAAPVREVPSGVAHPAAGPSQPPRKGRSRRLTAEQKAEVVRLYFEEGITGMRELVARTGLPQHAMAPIIGLERKRRAGQGEPAQGPSSRAHARGCVAMGCVEVPNALPPTLNDAESLRTRDRCAPTDVLVRIGSAPRPSLAQALDLLQSPEVRAYRALPPDVREAVDRLLALDTA